MPIVKPIVRPAGQSEDYRFFKNEETDNVFKAKHEIVETVNGDPVAAITVSHADASTGKAIVAEGEDAPVIHTHNHTFTETELKDPAFDPEKRIAQIMDGIITDRENIIQNKAKLKAFAERWKK